MTSAIAKFHLTLILAVDGPHHHYDHSDADEDSKVVFRIDVLRDLEAERFIGGIAKKHIGYMGATMQLKAMYEGTAREIANDIDRGSRQGPVSLRKRNLLPDRNYVANFTDKA
ncbi:MAG TPA: glycine/sarcosine/betaine reductase selenoprotein B family protein [Pyrinomonadaceae bacterium]